MSRRRVLLLLKPLDVYPPRPRAATSSSSSSPPVDQKIINFLDDRCMVHKNTIKLCKDVLQKKCLDWVPLLRNDLSQPIRDVDLVITVGGDGTLLQTSHFLDDSIPVMGVNSDPTRAEEVNNLSDEFDATRSTGYLCAATAHNFEQRIDAILEGHVHPSELSRMSIGINGRRVLPYALNDILIAHPCPAAVSRFSFRIQNNNGQLSRLINCRSSGVRVSTSAGSTAAMFSAGGLTMPILGQDLQYMVREPISSRKDEMQSINGFVKPDQSLCVRWNSREGQIYIDGSHQSHSVQHGDSIDVSIKAPLLKVYLDHVPSLDSGHNKSLQEML